VSLPEDQLTELKQFFGEIQTAKEGGITYVFLPGARLPSGCVPQRMDLLLCPMPRDGYESRLYFASHVQSTKSNLNWNGNTRVLERNWVAYSWKIQGGLRLLQMVQAHMQALR
jgi:hypothetical protein